MNANPLSQFLRRNFSIRLFLGCLACLIPASEAMAQERGPNILLILTDDQGYGDVGVCGAKDLRTPNLDRLFNEGVRIDPFYANSTVCSPTRAALLTGRYPDLAGVPGVIRTHKDDNWGFLRPDSVLLPQVLQKAGYHTAIIGKWHLGLNSPNVPNERGFDFFHGFLGDMMDDYYHHRRHDNNYMRRNGEVIEPKGHATDLFTDWACAYLEERSRSERPFFLYLAYNAPHTPIQPPDQWLERVQRRHPDLSLKRAKLVALIEHMDAGIGRVLDTLNQTGLDQNTLVIFTSDNGGQVDVGGDNGPYRGGKQSMYEGGLRVPFAARWPGKIRAGTRSEQIAMSMDLFPTIIEAAGAGPIQHHIEGRTFLNALLGKASPELKRDLYFTRREGGLAYGGKTIDAFRRGDWKLLQNSPYAPLELYNLKEDPLEKNNVAAKETRIFNELAAALRRQIQHGGAVPWQPPELANP